MKLNITVDGKTFEVDVEVSEEEQKQSGPQYYGATQFPAAAPPAQPVTVPTGAAAPGGSVDEQKVCRSPIAGVVVRLTAQPGQQIQANDPLLVLEAMKMETNITAPTAGKVKAINVAAGAAVQIGQILVEFE